MIIKRYSIGLHKKELQEKFQLTNIGNFQTIYNASQGMTLPIIRNDDPNNLQFHTWGIIPENSTDSKACEKNSNAYAKTIKAKAPFCDLIQTKRCIIPADGFFIWDHANNKIFRYTAFDKSPLAIAGVWEDWGEDSLHFKTFAMITTESNSTISKICEHMPAILPLEMAKQWLSNELKLHEITDVLRPYSPLYLKATEVGPEVNDLNNNTIKVITPIGDTLPGETLSLF